MSSLDTSKDFLKHVFNMNEDSKTDMINIVQYAIISVIPVVFLNKSMSKYVPEADERKGSVELSAEVVLQVIVMFVGMLLIHRVNTFIPTFSGEKYPDFNIIYVILSVLMITLSLQTKLGEKVSILSDRVMQLWEGREGLTSQPAKVNSNGNGNGNSNSNGNIKVSQPLSNQSQQVHSHPENIALNSTPISQLPMNSPPTTQTTSAMMDNNVQSNDMPMMQQDTFEPMASNDSGGNFSAW
jgi:hypothetical protein